MKFRHFVISICLYYCCLSQTSGQLRENAIPLSVSENLPPITSFNDLQPTDSSICKKMAVPGQGVTNQLQFACPIYTDLDPDNSGQWDETASGSIWRLGIRSVNAYSLYITMRFMLSPDANLFVYSPGYRDLHGAFTSVNNNPAGLLSIEPVQGDMLIVELNLPTGEHDFGEIKVTKVYHDFLNIFKDPSAQGLKSSTNCDEDINCSNGRYWQTEKRSVCKIITNGGMGTGTLVGNTSGSNTPYILSAYHLISSAEIAAEAIFLFNYETTGCQENMTTTGQSLSGATLVSTTDHRIDFALMRLYETPPFSYRPWYAGWNAKNIFSQKGICIHHPFGNSKQIAIEYHPIKSEDINKGFDENSTWKIAHWELGTTESGSSGAPLFNENHRIIGTLSGGRSTCGYPRDDYFTKFYYSWDAYPQPSNQLKYWLDPGQTGQLELNGYDPYGFNAEFCDTNWNFSASEKLELSSEGLNWGWISGHNSAGYTQFAERYESPGGVQITGVYFYVAKAYAANSLANIELKVWEGDQYPEKECYSDLLFINDLLPNKVNYVAFDSVLKKSGSFYVGYKINYNAVSDTFAVYHVMDRGHTKASSMYVYNEIWHQAKDLAAIGIYTSLGIGISECYGKSREPATDVLNVYPNPCSNSVTLDIPGGVPVLEVKCFDINGRPVTVNLRQTEEDTRLFFNLITGMYFLKIITAEKIFVSRFIVLKE